jgi:hypothetical protein
MEQQQQQVKQQTPAHSESFIYGINNPSLTLFRKTYGELDPLT